MNAEELFIMEYLNGNSHPHTILAHIGSISLNSDQSVKYLSNVSSDIKFKIFEEIKEGTIWEPRIALTPLQKKAIIKRDKNKCIECDSEQDLEVHHIDCNPGDYSQENLVTLCKKCHPKGDNTVFWIPYLEKKVESMPKIDFPKFSSNRKDVKFIEYHRALKRENEKLKHYKRENENLKNYKNEELKQHIIQLKIENKELKYDIKELEIENNKLKNELKSKNPFQAFNYIYMKYQSSLEERRKLELKHDSLTKIIKDKEREIYNLNEKLYHSKLRANRLELELAQKESSKLMYLKIYITNYLNYKFDKIASYFRRKLSNLND